MDKIYEQYHREGCLKIENFLTPDEVEELRKGLSDVVENVADDNSYVFSVYRTGAQKDTCFGYIVASSTEPIFQINNATSHCFLSRGLDTLDKTLRSFWEIENVTCDSSPISEELNYCNEHYEKTHYRNSEGRYVVQCPLNLRLKKISLGDSYQMTSKRLYNLQKRLNRDPTMKFLYLEFLREYKNLNHMEEITNCNHSNDDYFLPHQGVLRPSSVTTTLKVVFDASLSVVVVVKCRPQLVTL
ncbi:hypothetical protein AVEN_107847-1 [Araneus ventricosus]|uniref:Uncharacterized protein n=1 Tax=Araneus ventricosus TaxID=182803 RepID=A0A4Y2KUI4_ARAVE|nr:hypothetical protein AVEN_107847-1 [Araneus ventricosus]